MVEISRLWDILDFEDRLDIKLLYKRPRVDYRISEYVFDYIDKNILKTNKIMQAGNFKICLAFTFYDKKHFKYFDNTAFDTQDTKYSISRTSNRIGISCYSIGITEKIKPKDYANIVYDMIGAFLVENYKKITKETMDNNKDGMDYRFIEKFKFPALFDDQKYLTDNIEQSHSNGEVLVEVNIKEEYLKHYRE